MIGLVLCCDCVIEIGLGEREGYNYEILYALRDRDF